MRQVYVRGHYRRRKKQRRQRTPIWVYLLLVGILIVVLPKLLMAIPSFVYVIFFVLLFGGVALLVTYRIYQIRQAREMHALSQGVYEPPEQSVQTRAPHVKTLGEVLTLTPPEFEELVGVLIRARGYVEVQRVGGSGDLGVDLLCRDPEGRRVMVQCKRYAPGRAIGTPDLQRFIGMMVTQHYAERGIFVTTSIFRQTIDDIEHVRTGKVTLIDRTALVNWIYNTL